MPVTTTRRLLKIVPMKQRQNCRWWMKTCSAAMFRRAAADDA